MATTETDDLPLFASPPARLGRTFDPGLDGPRLANATARVLDLLLDGEFHSLDDLRAVGGAQGERRMRDLRDRRHGAMQIVGERWHGGAWRYRLMRPTPEQLDLACTTLRIPPLAWRGA